MTEEQIEKVKKFMRSLEIRLQNRREALEMAKAPYLPGGSKQGQCPDPVCELAIRGIADTVVAWEASKIFLLETFPELWPKVDEEDGK